MRVFGTWSRGAVGRLPGALGGKNQTAHRGRGSKANAGLNNL